MPDYTIWRFSTSQLRGQGSFRASPSGESKGTAVGTVAGNDSHDALNRFLSDGGVEGRHIELTVVRDPRGQDESSVEVAYQLYVARRAKPPLIAEEPKVQELVDAEDDED
ncbi:MAG: hypothetical protein P4L93_11035 [Coriobacteriia bacterium]|nr:hypothetical protein [Coriobacteriia bacterium]